MAVRADVAAPKLWPPRRALATHPRASSALAAWTVCALFRQDKEAYQKFCVVLAAQGAELPKDPTDAQCGGGVLCKGDVR